jgi:hypothetical protein
MGQILLVVGDIERCSKARQGRALLVAQIINSSVGALATNLTSACVSPVPPPHDNLMDLGAIEWQVNDGNPHIAEDEGDFRRRVHDALKIAIQ